VNLLLDTHTLLWWAHEPAELSATALEAIADERNEVFASAVSAMEIATKQRGGKLEYTTPLASRFLEVLADFGFKPLSVSCAHAQLAGSLPGDHRDPWDRLLAAQSQVEQLPLVSMDKRIAEWKISTLW
jgi:PIN domain nuclease of toxin-antitoxin system